MGGGGLYESRLPYGINLYVQSKFGRGAMSLYIPYYKIVLKVSTKTVIFAMF